MEEELDKLKEALTKSTEKYLASVEEGSDSKAAADEMCHIAETTAKIEDLAEQRKTEKAKINLEKLKNGLMIVGAAIGTFAMRYVLQKDDQHFRRNMQRENWQNERDGVIMSPTGKYWNQESVKNSK